MSARPRVSSDKGPGIPTKTLHEPLGCLSLDPLCCQQRNTVDRYPSYGFQPRNTQSTQNYTPIFYCSYSIFCSKTELVQAIVFLSYYA